LYEAKQKRLARLNEVIGELSLEHHRSLVGQVIEVLVEGESKNKANVLSGRSRSNKLIHFEGNKEWIGQFVQVKITYAQTWYLKAEVVAEPAMPSQAG